MGLIQLDLFVSLHGVAQAPGGREEDPDGGFRFGGWQAPLVDEVVGEQITQVIASTDALLLGRRTYDIWAAHWPTDAAPSGPIADRINAVPKYVASRTLVEPGWSGTTVLGPDLAAGLATIRERHALTHIWGSTDLTQSLLAAGLIDRLVLWIHPVMLGEGKRLFGAGVVPTNVRLLEPAVTSPRGVVLLRYAIERTEPSVGEMSAAA